MREAFVGFDSAWTNRADMATNRERVGIALDLLKAGLGPFVDRAVKNQRAIRPLCGSSAGTLCPTACVTDLEAHGVGVALAEVQG